MITVILVTVAMIMGIIWNHYILKITPERIEPQIIGIATHGMVTVRGARAGSPFIGVATAAESIQVGELVVFNELGEVEKAKKWGYKQ